MKLTGVGHRPPHDFSVNLNACIADFMGGYYGLFGTEMSTSEPTRRDLLIKVVHGDKPEEVLAEKRFRLPTIGEIAQPGDNTIDDPLNGGAYREEYRGLSAAVTVRPGVVAFGVQTQSGDRAALSTFHWDGRDVTMGRHIPVIDRKYADPDPYGHDEGHYTVGGYGMVFPGLTWPGGGPITINSQPILFAYNGRVLAFNPYYAPHASPEESVAALRWYRIDAGGLVPDGGWVYKRHLRADYWHGGPGSAAGMVGRFAYLLSARYGFNNDTLWMMRIDMDTLALSEVRLFESTPNQPPNSLNLTPRGVEMVLADEEVMTVTPDLKVTTRSVARGYEAVQKASGYQWISRISQQNLPQASILVMRPSAVTSSYIPSAPPLSHPDEGVMFLTVDGKEYAAWIDGEQISSLPGGSQLYIGTTHAIRTCYQPYDLRATFVRLSDVGNLAPGEHSARGFFT